MGDVLLLAPHAGCGVMGFDGSPCEAPAVARVRAGVDTDEWCKPRDPDELPECSWVLVCEQCIQGWLQAQWQKAAEAWLGVNRPGASFYSDEDWKRARKATSAARELSTHLRVS